MSEPYHYEFVTEWTIDGALGELSRSARMWKHPRAGGTPFTYPQPFWSWVNRMA
jgi:hypothetical protein